MNCVIITIQLPCVPNSMSFKVSQSYKKFNLRINVTIISLTTDGRSYVDLPHASLTQEVTPCEQEQTLQLSTMSINVAPSGTIVPDTLQAEMQTIGEMWSCCRYN